MFLATQGKIRDTLKEKIKEIKNYEELFCDIVNTAITMYENKSYLTPAEKHTLVKVLWLNVHRNVAVWNNFKLSILLAGYQLIFP